MLKALATVFSKTVVELLTYTFPKHKGQNDYSQDLNLQCGCPTVSVGLPNSHEKVFVFPLPHKHTNVNFEIKVGKKYEPHADTARTFAYESQELGGRLILPLGNRTSQPDPSEFQFAQL